MRSAALALLLAGAFSAPPARADETLSCTSEKRLGGGASKNAELKLVVAGDSVKDLSYSGCYSSGEPGGGSCCGIERDESETWSFTHSGAVTVLTIEMHDLEKTFKIEIERTPDAYQVRFSDRGLFILCGSAAEFPRSVTIRRGERACHVVEE